MDIVRNHAVKVIVGALLATVVLQIAYMAFLGGPRPAEAGASLTNADVIRYFDESGRSIKLVWGLEAAAFIAIALGGCVALARSATLPFAWAAIGLSGVFNLIQIGFGLAIFEPAARLGGDEMGLFSIFVSGAFFFYFLAKALIGIAASLFGLRLLQGPSTGIKALGAVTLLVGIAALCVNLGAMAFGNPLLLIAGAVGTLATLFAGISGWVVMRATK